MISKQEILSKWEQVEAVYIFFDEVEDASNFVIGDTKFEIETHNEMFQISFFAKTKGGYTSAKKRKTDVRLKLTPVEGGYSVDKEQALELIEKYYEGDFRSYRKEIDATTAFGLAGNKYGWIYDRI